MPAADAGDQGTVPRWRIETEGEDRIPEIIEYCGFTQEQIVLLRELFQQ